MIDIQASLLNHTFTKFFISSKHQHKPKSLKHLFPFLLENATGFPFFFITNRIQQNTKFKQNKLKDCKGKMKGDSKLITLALDRDHMKVIYDVPILRN